MNFLETWDHMCGLARETGAPVVLLKENAGRPAGHLVVAPYDEAISARTMHPAFMATPTPKFDPERDK